MHSTGQFAYPVYGHGTSNLKSTVVITTCYSTYICCWRCSFTCLHSQQNNESDNDIIVKTENSSILWMDMTFLSIVITFAKSLAVFRSWECQSWQLKEDHIESQWLHRQPSSRYGLCTLAYRNIVQLYLEKQESEQENRMFNKDQKFNYVDKENPHVM